MAEKFNFPKLTTTNWNTWKFRMEQLLTREEIWWVIEEAKPEPVTDQWRKDDSKAKATIGLCVEETQIGLIRNATSARARWNALKDHYEKNTVTSRVSLLKKLCNKNLYEGESMVNHLMELDELFDRLRAADLELAKELKVAMILRSLPESYDGLVVALEARPDDDITVALVHQKLTDEFQKREDQRGGAAGENRVLRTFSSKTTDSRVCFYCKRPGHLRKDCRKFLASKQEEDEQQVPAKKKKDQRANQAQRSKSPLCFLTRQSESLNEAVAVGATSCSVAGGQIALWYVDSGASHHMTHSKEFFTTLNEHERVPVTLANGEKTMSEGCGTGMLRCIDGDGECVDVKLEKVLWVPKLDSNLLSVSAIQSKNFSVVFDDKGCQILDRFNRVRVVANRCAGMYVLRQEERTMFSNAARHTIFCQHTWHRRFGHRDYDVVNQIANKCLGDGMKIVDCGERLVCECCLQGKLARKSFPKKAERRSSEILELVHTDLCGPFENVTPGGKRYFMTVIDDYSRYAMVFLLEKKSEAGSKIQEYVKLMETQFGKKPRTIRSDNGGEYVNRELQNFLKAEGIRTEYTAPYSPQQNGVAERKNRYLQEMVLCMLLDAKLPKQYWGEAIMTATFLQNRLPSRSIDSTPFERWFQRKPNVKDLKVFGCEAYVHIPCAKRRKMGDKSRKLVFVGYCSESKAYRFLDPSTNKITISRDAVFLELGSSSEPEQVEVGEISTEHLVEVEFKKKADVEAVQTDEVDEDDSGDEFFGFDNTDEENQEANGPRRSSRTNKGVLPSRFHDYEVELAADSNEAGSHYALACKAKEQHRVAMEEELRAFTENRPWMLLRKCSEILGLAPIE